MIIHKELFFMSNNRLCSLLAAQAAVPPRAIVQEDGDGTGLS